MNARFLSSLFLAAALATAACSGGDGDLDTPRSPLPAQLAGSWYTGTLSSIQYYDRNTGVFQNPSGSGFYYVFSSDGSYETGAVIDSTVAGCTMRLLGVEAGTVTLDSQGLQIYRHWITTRVKNSCGSDGQRTQGPTTRRMSWSVTLDETGLEWLTLTHDDGTVERYRRWA